MSGKQLLFIPYKGQPSKKVFLYHIPIEYILFIIYLTYITFMVKLEYKPPNDTSTNMQQLHEIL